MTELWKAAKEGGISGAATFVALWMTICGIVLVSIAIVAYGLLYLTKRLAGSDDAYESPFDLTLVDICDTYQYWYEKITNSLKNLVK